MISSSIYGIDYPYNVSSDGTDVWVANYNANSVTEFDAATGGLVRVISGSSFGFSFPYAIASDGTYVWVTDEGNNSVTELSASTGALVQILSASSYGFNVPSSVSADGTHIWITNQFGSSVTELSASTGALVQVLSSPTYGFNHPGQVSSDGTHVWVTNNEVSKPYSVTELNASTGGLVQVISGSSYGFDQPAGISSDGTHVWVTNNDIPDNTYSVTELNASTGALVQVISGSNYGFGGPGSIASDGTDVWITNYVSNAVTELDASTGALVQVLSGSTYGFNYPRGISADGTDVWVANTHADSIIELDAGYKGITFTSAPPANAVVGGPPYTVTAAGDGSGNPVVFSIDSSSTSVCSISGATVTFMGGGTCTIDANQASADGYPAPPQVQQSFIVGAQHIVFTSTPPSNAVVGGPPYTVTATGGPSGNPVVYSIAPTTASVCSISGATVSFIATGNCTIYANQAAGNGYIAAPRVQQSVFVQGSGGGGGGGGGGTLPQNVVFTSTPPSNAVVGGPSYTVMATGGASGNPVTFFSLPPSVCVTSGSTVSFVGVGTCAVEAEQAGNSQYQPGSAAQTFSVGETVGPCGIPAVTRCFTGVSSAQRHRWLVLHFPSENDGDTRARDHREWWAPQRSEVPQGNRQRQP